MDDDDDTLKSNSGNTDPPSNPRAILQMGRAIDVLRRELPFLFDCGLQDWSIYHERVQLSEGQHYRFHVRGLWLYRRFLGAARHVLQFYFSDLEFRVRSVTQQHVEGGTGFVTDTSSTSREHGRDAIPAVEVVVRWTLEGTPKPSLLWRNVTLSAQRTLESLPESVVGPSSTVGSSTNSSGTSNNGNAAETASQNPSLIRRSIYEGMFVYRFDPTTGLIIEHRVENVVPAPFAKFAPLRAIGWWQQRGKLSLVD